MGRIIVLVLALLGTAGCMDMVPEETPAPRPAPSSFSCARCGGSYPQPGNCPKCGDALRR